MIFKSFCASIKHQIKERQIQGANCQKRERQIGKLVLGPISPVEQARLGSCLSHGKQWEWGLEDLSNTTSLGERGGRMG